ncbi:Mycobacterial persistence regulator A, partial [Dysosmobacter welbionis]
QGCMSPRSFPGPLFRLRAKVKSDHHGEHGQELLRGHPARSGHGSKYRRQNHRHQTLHRQQAGQALCQQLHLSPPPSAHRPAGGIAFRPYRHRRSPGPCPRPPCGRSPHGPFPGCPHRGPECPSRWPRPASLPPGSPA